ncbi:threonine/serine exporter family protein [Aliarcobacter skirrowii]|uniref:Threonine/Serine exporter ThrE domain-containing protein n=1 Tax=Aliarcobacter skirrowii TaxID=28200 RepID=A0A2U2C1P3_9BACT|nr:threonine/serine exporter family protein [Aliarcobacter skirrowii]AZL54594.1 threonine/serine exporter [Aliarcobacter skirrowii]MCT7446298.1 threonine/serine exporter family protein [Aliarcobacter skirrowii]MDD2508268.1 threonine/serine exporter family protein [Aliarcobacter skirrowii]MDD3496666.1 threonine/serine exporter family protein [Aliarcobacter skirrowii]MDX4012055.1 threonine/serine exporter family protein [Aliarcobacter skirrowii]
MELLIQLCVQAVFAAIASLGFAMVFNVPKHTLKYCAFGGAITYNFRTIFLELDFGIELATFLASAIIGVVALYWSRKYKVPRPVYTVASIIPVLPGTYAFNAMVTLISINRFGAKPELVELFIHDGLKSISILFAITFGLVLPSLYFLRLNRPVI